MNTIIKPAYAEKTGVTKTQSSGIWEKAEEARFGIIPILLIVIGCMGGIAAAFGAYDNTAQLITVAIPTMLTLSFMLAVGPMRLILWSSAVAIALDLLILFV